MKFIEFIRRKQISLALLVAGLLYCLTPWSSSVTALVGGIIFALLTENPYIEKTKEYAPKLMAMSIIGLGAGTNFHIISEAGLSGIIITAASITGTMLIGYFIGKLVNSERDTSYLISIGTAICGGSAIAALSPVLRAKSQSIAIALGTVFLLNAVAFLTFPTIGHYFNLSQHQFGMWSGIAIHDTSSVVAAGMQYGDEAMHVGVIVKLARALWIAPITLGFAFFLHKENSDENHKIKIPWFIFGFMAMAAIVTWVPSTQNIGHHIELIARKTLLATLFLVGSNLTVSTLKSVGIRPVIQGFSLWVIVSVTSLALIKHFVS